MREQKHSQASPRSAMRFNAGAVSFPSGYYEWQKLPGGAKQPFYITRRDGLPIAFAGLWENAKELHGTTAIVTTSEETQQIHDRMPIIFEKPDFLRLLASEVDQTGGQKIVSTEEVSSIERHAKGLKDH